MKIEDGKTLQKVVAKYLGDAQPEGFPSPEEFGHLSVESDRHGRIRIGSWVYEPAAGTLTDYAPPGQRAGYDRIMHVVGQGCDWKVERVSLVEVFGTDRWL